MKMSVHKDTRNNTWYVKYNNKTKRGFKTKKDGQQYEAKLKLSLIENADCSKIYFSDIANDYVKFLYQRYLNKNISYGTYLKNKNAILEIILPNVINKKVSAIAELDCRKFSEKVSSMNYSTVHKNYVLNAYKAIFKHGKRYFGMTHDPSHVIEPLKKTFEEKVNHKDKETNVWSIDEFERFLAQVDKNMYRQLFAVLYFTGLRSGEALALKWSDYDGEYLHITKAFTRKTESKKYEIKETKNISSIRDIDVGTSLKAFLDEFKQSEEQQLGFSDDWFMFGRLEPLAQTSIDRVKDNAIKKAHVKRIRIHDFRHSHASNLISNGINIVAVSRRLGHSDINMTLKVYTHLMKKNEIELTNFLDESSQNLLSKKKKPFK